MLAEVSTSSSIFALLSSLEGHPYHSAGGKAPVTGSQVAAGTQIIQSQSVSINGFAELYRVRGQLVRQVSKRSVETYLGTARDPD